MVDVDALRAQTPGCAQRVHLNNAGAGLLAQPTLDVMIGHLRREAEVGGYEAADAARDDIAAVYTAVAELVGGAPGLGEFIYNAQTAGNYDTMYAYIAFAGVLGVIINAAIRRVEKRVLRWHVLHREGIE